MQFHYNSSQQSSHTFYNPFVVHHGAFEDFTQGHTAILTWMEANGYRAAGPYREIYIHTDTSNMAESATEIQYPVEHD